MATLLSIVDPYVTINGKAVASASLSTETLKQYVLNHPTVLKAGWIVSGGQIVQKPAAAPAPSIGTVPVGTPPPTVAPPTSGIGTVPVGTPPPTNGTGGGGGATNPTPTTPAPVTPSPTPVAPPPPPAPTLGQFGSYQDAQYWMDLANLRNQLGLVQNPDGSLISQASQAKLAGLNQHFDPTTLAPTATGGKTMYETLYGQQQGNDQTAYDRARSEAARKGVTRSGYWDRTAGNLAGAAATAYDQLVRNYGTDLTDSRSAAYQASQSQGNLLTQYQQAQANIAQAAASRGYQSSLDQYRSTYGGY